MGVAIFVVGAALVVFSRTSASDFIDAFGGMVLILGAMLMVVGVLSGQGLTSECGTSWGTHGSESDC